MGGLTLDKWTRLKREDYKNFYKLDNSELYEALNTLKENDNLTENVSLLDKAIAVNIKTGETLE